jgi:hypothetical protein
VPTIGDSTGPESPFSELVRLQMDFQARLAEETLRYMRRIQASALPATPSTVVRAASDRPASRSTAGGSVTVVERLENRQRVHAIVTAALTPLVAGDGTTWFAQIEPATLIVPPGEHADLELRFQVPAELPAGTYRGALVLAGLEGAAVPVAIEVASKAKARRVVRRKVSRARKVSRK